MTKLLTPLKLGDLTLKNHMVMAPLTRCRASEGRVPNDLMVQYYTQRAGAGLILTEATIVDPMGAGYPDTPGIYSGDQVKGWQKVTESVHAADGRIFCQLWHVGRISHESYLGGKTPVAPSAIQPEGHVSLVRPKVGYPTPRALETAEVPQIVEAFIKGAKNAKQAGFDGVEIHAANGYLIDQFLQDSTNQRTDKYGGSIENRARFLLEIVDGCIEVWGASRVGVHLAPRADAHDMGDSDRKALFTYVAKELDKRGIAFIFTREHVAEDSLTPAMKNVFGGVMIGNESLDKATAEKLLEEGKVDAASFGKLFIANPDLPQRFAQNAPLNEWDASTFYGGGAEGYTDYPAL